MTPEVDRMLETINGRDDSETLEDNDCTFIEFVKFHVTTGRHTLESLMPEIDRSAWVYPDDPKWAYPSLLFDKPTLPVALTRIYTIYTHV